MTKFLLLAFVTLAVILTIFSYAFVDKNLSYLNFAYTAFSFNQRTITTIIFVFLISLLFVFYFFILKAVYENKIQWNQIKKLIFLTGLVLFFSYPGVVSYDIFNYATTAKVLFGYKENPYIVMPIEFVNDEFLNYTHATNKTALYGPLWLALSGIPYLLISWNFIIMMLGFKLLAASFYVLTLLIIWKITKKQFAVVFFGLNPLVIFETFVSAHNDIVMMTFALLSFYWLRNGKVISSGFSLLMSFLIKFATVFLLPVYLYMLLCKFKKRKIDWNKIYLASVFLMFAIFLLSPLREEIYPWYFIWVLSFIALTKNIKLYIFSSVFSFFLILRYIPFMYLGTHFGITPYLKIGVTFVPLFFLILIFSYFFLTSSSKKDE